MAEYISREAFIKDKRKQYCSDCDKRKGFKKGKYVFCYEIGEAPCRSCGIDDMLSDVEDYPAADAIGELQKAVNFHKFNSEFWEDKYNSLADEKWIPVTERLPETGVDVLVMFPHNMAAASRDIGEWVVNSGDGWCTDVNLSDDEKEPTHWMPLPEPPKEE